MSKALTVTLIAILAISAGLYVWGRRAVAEFEAAYPPIGTFVTVEGTKLHVLDRGQGPAVILIHGASGNLRDFSVSIVDELAKTHRVLAFDRPGLGWSDPYAGSGWCAPDCQARLIHDAAASMGVSRAVVLGHSWGGSVAMAYGLNFPDDVQGVVDLSGATHPWGGGGTWYNQLTGMPVLGPYFVNVLAVPLGKLLVGPSVKGAFRPNPPTPDYRETVGIELLFRAGNFTVNAENSRNLKAYNEVQAQRYPSFRPPLIIMTGAEDPMVSPKIHARPMKENLPSAELIELPGIGHMPHHVAPDQVIAAIDRLWAGAASEPGK